MENWNKWERDFQLSPLNSCSQSTVTFRVAVPNVTDKPEWKLNGQIISLALPLTDTVSTQRTGCVVAKSTRNREGFLAKLDRPCLSSKIL